MLCVLGEVPVPPPCGDYPLERRGGDGGGSGRDDSITCTTLSIPRDLYWIVFLWPKVILSSTFDVILKLFTFYIVCGVFWGLSPFAWRKPGG